MELDRLLQFMYYGEVKIPNNEMERFILAAGNLNVRGLSTVASPHLAAPPPHPPSTSVAPHPENEPQDLIVQNDSPKQIKRRRQSSGSSTSTKTPKLETSEPQTNCPEQQHQEPTSPPGVNSTEESFAHHVKVEILQNEEELDVVGGVSPPRGQIENVPPPPPITPSVFSRSIFHRHFDPQSSSQPTRSPVPPPSSSEPPRILPPNEPRKSGTCYFCKKAFMKNKQLMNHVCPKKPKIGGGGSSSASKNNSGSRASSN